MARKKSRRKVGTRFTVSNTGRGKKKLCMVQTSKGPRFTSDRSKTGSCKRKRPAAKKATAAKKKTTAAKKKTAKKKAAACATSQQIVRRGRAVTVARTKKGKFCGGTSGRAASASRASSAPSGPISVDRLGRYRRGGRRISTAAAETEMNPASSFDRKAVPAGQPGDVFRARNGAYMVRLPGGGTRILSKKQGERIMLARAPGGKVQSKQAIGKSSKAPIDARKASANPYSSVFTAPGVFKL